MQRRELKYILLRLLHSYFRCVASHAEAWIEMLLLILLRVLPECCLSCRGVNWNRSRWPHKIQKSYVASHAEAWIEIWLLLRLRPSPICCLSCRGVNWNTNWTPLNPTASSVASHAEAWIEMVRFLEFRTQICCLSCRGVNWNNSAVDIQNIERVASHAEAWIEILTQNQKPLNYRLPLMQRRELKSA